MKKTVTFLKKLKKNNNRDWFDAHKDEFKDAQNEFTEFIGGVAERIAGFDPVIKKALADKKTVKVFRIYRDVRFSKDTSPYKQNFGGVIAAGGMEGGTPCYYVHIEPGGTSFIGGGVHMPDPKTLARIRDKIDVKHKELARILSAAPFKKTFDGLVRESALKRVPRGFDKEHPAADFLKLKTFTAGRQYSDSEIQDNNFAREVAQTLKTLKPLNDWLRT